MPDIPGRFGIERCRSVDAHAHDDGWAREVDPERARLFAALVARPCGAEITVPRAAEIAITFCAPLRRLDRAGERDHLRERRQLPPEPLRALADEAQPAFGTLERLGDERRVPRLRPRPRARGSTHRLRLRPLRRPLCWTASRRRTAAARAARSGRASMPDEVGPPRGSSMAARIASDGGRMIFRRGPSTASRQRKGARAATLGGRSARTAQMRGRRSGAYRFQRFKCVRNMTTSFPGRGSGNRTHPMPSFRMR